MKQRKQLKDQLKDLFSDLTVPETAVELDAPHEDAEATSTEIERLEPVETQRDEPAQTQRDEPAELQRDEPVELQRDEPVELRRDEPVELRRDEPVELRRDEPLHRIHVEPTQKQLAGDRIRLQALQQQVKSLEQANSQLQKRAIRLEASTAVNRALASILDPEKLLQTAVDLIHDLFHLYHVSVFLLDDTGDWAELHTATGDAGQKLVAQPHHRLAVGGESVVGWVCAHRQSRIALDVSADPVTLENPLLPKTRAKLVLPLTANDTLLGALDLQSAKEDAFDDNDVHTLQDMADLVALALQNAYRLAETRRIAQQQQLVARVTQRLQQVTSEADVLILTLEELGETFDLAQATICLGTQAELREAGNGHEPEANAKAPQYKE